MRLTDRGRWDRRALKTMLKFALEAGKLMQLADKDIKLIASGASNYKTG